jgi:hypothetical protein
MAAFYKEFRLMRKKLPEEVLKFFREQGRLGGKRSLVTMTPEERTARAKKAVEARESKKKARRKQRS